MMHLLERIAADFEEAGVPLMALKGAALNLTLYSRADERPMGDLDLLVRPEHAREACTILEGLGGVRSMTLVRDDFFPRFYYHVAYRIGAVYPVLVELHVRLFGPLRYAEPSVAAAIWERAHYATIGEAEVRVPAADDMLINLAAHSALHGNARVMWLEDIRKWFQARRTEIDWERCLATAKAWHVVLPVREALERIERDFGPTFPPSFLHRLREVRVGWRDRLALYGVRHADEHPVRSALADLLCAPGLRFVLAHVRALLLPSEKYMADWYARHCGSGRVRGAGGSGRDSSEGRHAGYCGQVSHPACAGNRNWKTAAGVHLLRWLRPIRELVSG